MNLESLKESPSFRPLANLDYEQSLFFQKESNLNIIKSWDWLPLWIVGTSFDLSLYQENFLEVIADYRPIFSSKDLPTKNWWGPLDNLEKEKKLSSKVMALRCKNDLHINYLDEKIFDPKENYSGDILLREEFNFSGRGHHQYHGVKGRISLSDKALKKKYLASPLVNRGKDFSTWSDGGRTFYYENKVSKAGQYLGSFINNDKIPKILEGMDQEIRSWYRDQGAESGFGLDYFSWNDQIIFCEMNYRKTMGLMACAFQSILSERGPIFFGLEAFMEEESSLRLSSSLCPIKWGFHPIK